MISIETKTQITLLCSFKNKDENEFFDFDVSKDGDYNKSEFLYEKLMIDNDVLSVKYFIGNNFIKGFSKTVHLN